MGAGTALGAAGPPSAFTGSPHGAVWVGRTPKLPQIPPCCGQDASPRGRALRAPSSPACSTPTARGTPRALRARCQHLRAPRAEPLLPGRAPPPAPPAPRPPPASPQSLAGRCELPAAPPPLRQHPPDSPGTDRQPRTHTQPDGHTLPALTPSPPPSSPSAASRLAAEAPARPRPGTGGRRRRPGGERRGLNAQHRDRDRHTGQHRGGPRAVPAAPPVPPRACPVPLCPSHSPRRGRAAAAGLL